MVLRFKHRYPDERVLVQMSPIITIDDWTRVTHHTGDRVSVEKTIPDAGVVVNRSTRPAFICAVCAT